MFHIELRQFPHLARAFNLTADELHTRVVSPWLAGRPIELQDRLWEPGRVKLTIYQSRELAADELGMGRGWGTATREGEDVTDELLATARSQAEGPEELEEIKARLLAAVADQPQALSQVVGLVGDATWRVSERLRLAEQTVWELLHEGRLSLLKDGERVNRDRWQPVILDWAAWTDGRFAVSA